MDDQKSKEEEKIIPNHEYDGIHELDNPLPSWWLMTFYITIVFAAIYFAHYILGDGPTLKEELNKEMAARELLLWQKPKTTLPSEEKLLAMAKDPEKIKNGAVVFQAKCVSCHGSKGEGMIGPNLTDNFWIHGKGTLTDITQDIQGGFAEKGMPAWGAVLKEDELYSVASYIYSLKGSKPANAKAPQGEEIK